MNNSKLIERVRKLYAMSQDASSPNEAAIAAKRARKMMDDNGITLADLEQSEFGSVNATQTFSRLPAWFQAMAIGVAAANDCTVSRMMGVLTFNGFEQDAIGAQLMLDYLISAMEKQLKSYKKQTGKTGRADSGAFKMGFCIDLHGRLKEIASDRKAQSKASGEHGTDLVVIKQQLVAEKFGSTKTKSNNYTHSSKSDAAYEAGVAASQRTSLHKQTTGTTQGRLS